MKELNFYGNISDGKKHLTNHVTYSIMVLYYEGE